MTMLPMYSIYLFPATRLHVATSLLCYPCKKVFLLDLPFHTTNTDGAAALRRTYCTGKQTDVKLKQTHKTVCCLRLCMGWKMSTQLECIGGPMGDMTQTRHEKLFSSYTRTLRFVGLRNPPLEVTCMYAADQLKLVSSKYLECFHSIWPPMTVKTTINNPFIMLSNSQV